MQMSKITAVAELVQGVIAPLNKCKIAPENVRSDTDVIDDALIELAGSINSRVGLVNRPVAYEVDGEFFITAGGRRFRALRYLKANKALPKAFSKGIPLDLRSQADAVEISYAENHIREPMTPVHELKGFRLLASKGYEPEDIARMTGTRERHVTQMLRLTEVAPVVLDAFDRQELSLDALQAFAASSDQTRQIEAFEAGITNARAIRAALTEDTVRQTDYRVRFIGFDNYKDAGGRYTRDLFEEATYLLDTSIIDRLYDERIAAIAEKYKAEGWSEVRTDCFGAAPSGYRRIYPTTREMTEAEKERYDAAMSLIGASEDEDAPEVIQAYAVIDEIEASLSCFTPEQMADGVAVVRVLHGAPEVTFASPIPAVADDEGGPAVSTNTTQPKAVSAPFGHAGHERMTRIATTAVRNGLAVDPAAALDCLVAHSAFCCLRTSPYSSESALPVQRQVNIECEGVSLKSDRAYEDTYARWDEILPDTLPEVFTFVQGLSQDDKLALLALCTSLQVQAVEPRADNRRVGAWSQLNLMAQRISLNVSEQWVPEEDFLSNSGKTNLIEVVRSVGSDPTPYAKEKKGALVDIVARLVKAKNWVPPMLAALGQVEQEPSA